MSERRIVSTLLAIFMMSACTPLALRAANGGIKGKSRLAVWRERLKRLGEFMKVRGTVIRTNDGSIFLGGQSLPLGDTSPEKLDNLVGLTPLRLRFLSTRDYLLAAAYSGRTVDLKFYLDEEKGEGLVCSVIPHLPVLDKIYAKLDSSKRGVLKRFLTGFQDLVRNAYADEKDSSLQIGQLHIRREDGKLKACFRIMKPGGDAALLIPLSVEGWDEELLSSLDGRLIAAEMDGNAGRYKLLGFVPARAVFEEEEDDAGTAGSLLHTAIAAANSESIEKWIWKLYVRAQRGERIVIDDIVRPFQLTYLNRLDLKIGGDVFWPDLFEEIEKAKLCVNIHMFGMTAGELSWSLARLLAKKRKQGVEVNMLLDLVGARGAPLLVNRDCDKWGPNEELIDFLRRSGINVIYYLRLKQLLARRFVVLESGGLVENARSLISIYHFDHRKIFVIDGRIGYVGGLTIEDHMKSEMHDLMVKVEGECARQLQAIMMATAMYCGGRFKEGLDEESFIRRYFPPVPEELAKVKHPARIEQNIPWRRHEVTETYYRMIDESRKYLYLINPYFTNDKLVRKLIEAKKRGVDVKVIIPADPENKFNALNCTYHALQLAENGVEVYEYLGERNLGRLHAKGMLRDGEEVTLGSCNMDAVALKHNYEANLYSTDPEFVELVEHSLFRRDFLVSKRFKVEGRLERLKIKLKGILTNLVDNFD